MAKLAVINARKRFGSSDLFDGLDLDIADEEFVVLAGPSGCGKSTLLRLIAGLDRLDDGDIVIGETPVNDLSPSERRVAMVFQSYALYPQMTVAQNIGFPLKMAGLSKPEIDRSVRDAAEMLGLTPLLERRPGALSGGQRQRVAIGRAIVRKPDLFLFDEPLSNLDAGLRTEMRREFADLHRRLRTTTLYVTHDQSEAMALADRIVLMREGRIEQVGTPRELYQDPANLFVAGFFGNPAINRLSGRVVGLSDNRITIDVSGLSIELPLLSTDSVDKDAPVTLAVRPEQLTPSEGEGTIALPQARVDLVEWLGGECLVALDGPAGSIVWKAEGSREPRPGEPIILHAPQSAIMLFNDKGERLT